MKSLIRILVTACIAVSSVTVGDAGQESPFSLGGGARSYAMGGAFVALADDASAVYYNPAGLGMLDYQELSFMHTILFEGTSFNMASWVYPISERSGIGVAFMRVGTGDIIRRENYVDLGTFSYNHWQFLLDFGRRVHHAVSLGATMKIASQTIDGLSDYGTGADLGIKIDVYREFSVGFTARNIVSPSYKLDTTDESTPFNYTFGLALVRLRLSPNWTVSTTLDFEKFEKRSTKIHAGLEVTALDHFSVRGGFDRENLVVGAGLTSGHIKVDYAYGTMEYVEDAHRFSLAILIGESLSQQKARRAREEMLRSETLLEGERLRKFQSFRTQADEYYRQLRLDSALTYYQRALAYDPDNQEVIGTIAAIESIQRIQEEQEQRIREAQADQQRSVTTYYNQALAFYEKQYYPAALDLLNLVLEIDPEHQAATELKSRISVAVAQEIEAATQRARTAEQGGHMVAAIEAYNRILELDPGNTAIRQARAQAISSLDIAQQLNLGIDLYNKGRFTEAQAQFQLILRSDPNNSVAKEYLARIGTPLSPPTSPTLEDLQRDQVIWPIYLEGLRHMRNKEYQKAIEAWEQVLKAYPNNANAIDNIRQARLRMESESGQN